LGIVVSDWVIMLIGSSKLT